MQFAEKNAGNNHQRVRHKIGQSLHQFSEKTREARPMVAFFIVYLLWFCLIERWDRLRYIVVHMEIDDYIPFCEIFVIPYVLWFFYMFYTVLYMYVKDRREYHSVCASLVIGMTLFLVISTVIPNIQFLRPDPMPRDNVLTRLVSYLYSTDTATNLFPSIHVYNSVVATVSIWKSRGRLAGRKWFRYSALVLCALISLSTLFIKQHSMFDVLTALALCVPVYVLVYRFGFTFERRGRRKRKTALESGMNLE
ncbi:MAG: phosphatase PAP2 family protein [Eubacteriales bacterium]|nr:phosphatase PAP2 family protein [Eubacteriales bacterium]